MVSKLDLYILNSDNSVAPFPSEAEQIVLYDFAFEAQRMGSAPEITATIQASGSLENALTTKVFCEYKGERYYLKNLPESSKDNTDPRYTIDLTFVSERTILDNVYMIDAVQGDGNIDRYQSNSTIIVFTGTIEEFVSRLNASMAYTGVGYSVVLDEGIATESNLVSFQDKVFTEALQEGVKIFNVPYYYVGKVIHFGWSQSTIPTLKYGDGLLSINKSLRTERIINRATATGSSENIPYYYPNPTPNGYITPAINSRSGAEISVVNEAKLGKLATNSKLRYCEFETPLQVQGIYSSVSSLVANVDVAGAPILSTDGYVLIQKQSLTFVYIKVSWSSVTGGVDDFMIQYKAYIGDNKTKVRNIGVYAYTLEKRNSNIGEVDVAVLDASISAQIVGDYIVINSLPANQERYIGIVYSNDTNSYYGSVFYASPATALNDGWYIYNGDTRVEDRPVNIAQYGVLVKGTPTEGDEVSYSVTKKIPFATTLMPPIYRNSGGEHRFYDAINGVYEGVTFENEYSKENRKEAITKFENVKPTIVGVTNADGERIDMFAEFAYDLSDSDETEQTDKNSESFIHPYFYAKLRKIDGDNGFNLFAQAIESGEMTIEMTSGHCGACKFVIAVDENTQRNLVMVDANGNLIYDDATGKVKMASDAMGLDRQNDTQNYEVWIALKKDINTYGQVMPIANSTIKPSIDDTFVITNILLPQAYITAAEKKLEDEIITFLVNNNTFQFEYGINFSRIFLKKRNDVFSTLSENALIPIEYNGKLLSFYVASYSYRKQKGELLPEISVSLTDNFESTPSGIEQVINAVQESIIKSGEPSGLTLGYTDERYVRKDAPDTVKERIAFDKGLDFKGSLTSRDFRRGYFAGAGFGVYTDDNGDAIIEADKLVIRKDLEVNNLVINQVSYVGGMQITSAASLEINRVIENDNAYQCFFDQKGGSVGNLFQVNDIAYSQRFDEENNTTKYYKRVVIAVDIDSITLSKSQADGEGLPMANDVVIQYGNTTDTNRQYIIIRDVIGGGYERMLSDLNSVSATGVEYYFAGRMDGDTPRWFVGNNEQFIEYKDGHLQINADVTLGSGSDLSASEEFQDVKQTANQAKQDAQNAEASAKSYADELVKDLQNQLDGKVESFFYGYDPTLSNLPASEWTTDELKEEHLNDTFTNTESGQSWRWLFKDGSYQWVEIADTQSSEALAKAQEALGVANGKVAVFVTEPRTPYNAKDLWLQGEDGRIKRCTTTRTTTGEFYAEDWVNADDSHEYTDDKIAKYKQSVDATIANLDKAIEDAEKTSKDYTDEGKKALQASIDALNKAKANVDDVYDKATADGLINQAEYDAISAAQELANAAQELAVETSKAYADGEVDKEEAARIKQAQENLNTAKKYAEEKAKEAEDNAKDEIDTFDYLKQAMAQNTTLSGGLVQTTLLQLGYRVRDNLIVQSGTNGIYNSDLKGGGIASWWGGDMLDKEVEGVTGRVAQALLRMDGTGYLAGGNITWDLYGAGSVAGGNLSWDKDGNITLSDNIRISSDKDETLGTVLTSISKLQSSLTSFKSLFDSMFEKDSDGNIHAKLSLWSSGGITAGGVGSGGSGGGGGISYNRLDAWADYTADKAGYVLSAYLGKDLDNRVTALANAGYVTQSALAPYALRSEIPSLEPYFLSSNFTKSNIKATLGISDWALASVKPTYTASEVGALRLNESSSNVDLDTILGSKTAELTPFFQVLTTNDIGSARKGVLRMSYNGSESQLLFDHYNGNLQYRTIGENPKGWRKIAFTSDIPSLVGYATQSWVGDNYLSKSGGKLVYSGAQGLEAERTDGAPTHIMFIGLVNGTTRQLGGFGMNGYNDPVYVNPNGIRHKVLTAENYSSYALPLTGGIMAKNSYIDWGNTDGFEDYSAYSNGFKILGYNAGSGDYRGGIHVGVRYGWQLTRNAGSEVFQIRNYSPSSASWGDWKTIAFTSDIPTKLSQLTDDVVEGKYLSLAGGTVNGILSVASVLRMSDVDGIYKDILQRDSSGNILFGGGFAANNMYIDADVLRIRANETKFSQKVTAPSFIGNLTGNADSATKLATPRTIWGQSFDGTGNISGNLSSGAWRIITDNSTQGVFVQAKLVDSTSDAGRVFITGYSGGRLSLFNVWSDTTRIKGNVGINIDYPSEALHVNGNGKFTGVLTANSLTIGGATITYDSANEALCINGNMYALGGITAGGAGISAYTSLEARVARLEQQLNIS